MNSINKTIGSRLAHGLVCYPKTIMVVFGLMTLVPGWFVQNFKIDASADTLPVKNNRLYIKTEVMNQRFSPQEFILVAYKPRNSPVFSNSTVKSIHSLANEFAQLKRVALVTTILNVPYLKSCSDPITHLNTIN